MKPSLTRADGILSTRNDCTVLYVPIDEEEKNKFFFSIEEFCNASNKRSNDVHAYGRRQSGVCAHGPGRDKKKKWTVKDDVHMLQIRSA